MFVCLRKKTYLCVTNVTTMMNNMMQPKKLCFLFSVFYLMSTMVSAKDGEEKTVVYPQLFFGMQGGVQTTLTDNCCWDLFSPTASFSFGSFFTPVAGARLHINGIWNKGRYMDDDENFNYKYKYLTTNVDLLINLVTLIGKRNYYPVNVYLIGGIGLNYAWNNDEAFARKDKLVLANDGGSFSHNARIGAQLDYNISKHVSLNLEVAANTLKDRYNSKLSTKGDWQLTAQLGVAYKFAAKKTKKVKEPVIPEPEIEPEVWETRIDTIWYDDVDITPKSENGTRTWNIYYGIRESNFDAEEQLVSIGSFLKDFHDCRVEIKSYSDAKTGNPKINMEISKQRCEKAVKALTDAGVPTTSITANYYGDTIQPYDENNKNRVTIIVASGLKVTSEKKMLKKYKTKEVRYRIK